MPCLVVLIALFAPRLAIVLLVIFSDYIGTAFPEGALTRVVIPFLGFLFMPYTLLAWAVAWHNGTDGVTGLEWLIVAVAVLIDLGVLGGGAKAKADGRKNVRVRRD